MIPSCCRFLSHIRGASDGDLGGGYKTDYGCRRALMEAFNGLFYSFDAVRAATPSVIEVEMEDVS